MIIPTSDQNQHATRPWVNTSLVAINLLVFVVARSWQGAEDYGEFLMHWGFVASDPHPITLVTAIFVHADWLHLVGNLIFLWIFGDNVEDWLGHGAYFAFYIVVGVMSLCAHMAMTSTPDIAVVGASGATSGVMGAYLVLLPRNKITFWCLLHYAIFFQIQAPALAAIAIFFLKDAVLDLLQVQDAVAHWAHLGGFLWGAAIVLTIRSLAFRRARTAQFGGAAVGVPWSGSDGMKLDHPEERPSPAAAALAERFAESRRSGNVDRILHAYIDLAGAYRRLPITDADLLTVARELIALGHETVGANALERLILRDPRAPVAADAHLQLAELYAGPLSDASRARRHAALVLTRCDSPRLQAAAESLLSSQPEIDHSTRVVSALIDLDVQSDIGRRRRALATVKFPLTWRASVAEVSAGIVARRVPPGQVSGALERLRDAGLACAATADLPARAVPPVELVQRARVGAGEIEIVDWRGRSLVLPYETLVMALGSFREVRSAGASVLRPGQRRLGRGGGLLALGVAPGGEADAAWLRVVARLDLLVEAGGDLRRHRIEEDLTTVEAPPAEWGDPPPLQRLARAILAHDELLFVAGGVAAMAGLEAPTPFLLRRTAQEDAMTRYWLARLAVAKRPVSRRVV